MTDVIVPAHNEGPRIGAVLAAIRGSSAVSQLIVVADDCTDDTVAQATGYADQIVSIGAHDKGSAMAAGLTKVGSPLVAFIDGDIEGLQSEHVTALLTYPPLEGQVVGLRSGYPKIFGALPSVSGERRIPTWLAQEVPLAGAGWKSETLINAAVARAGLPWRHIVLHGVTNLAKGKIIHDPRGWLDELVRVLDVVGTYAPEMIRYMAHRNGATTFRGVPQSGQL